MIPRIKLKMYRWLLTPAWRAAPLHAPVRRQLSWYSRISGNAHRLRESDVAIAHLAPIRSDRSGVAASMRRMHLSTAAPSSVEDYSQAQNMNADRLMESRAQMPTKSGESWVSVRKHQRTRQLTRVQFKDKVCDRQGVDTAEARSQIFIHGINNRYCTLPCFKV
jgi:hypothetical protein